MVRRDRPAREAIGDARVVVTGGAEAWPEQDAGRGRIPPLLDCYAVDDPAVHAIDATPIGKALPRGMH